MPNRKRSKRRSQDDAVRDARDAMRELDRELAKMGPFTDEDADSMIDTVDSDDRDEDCD